MPVTLKDGLDSREIELIQKALFEIGLYIDSIDGIKGFRTRRAIKYFQKLHNLFPTGDIDELTLENLFPEYQQDRMDEQELGNKGISSISEINDYFGEKGENQVKLDLPYTMKIAWSTDQKITRFSCHKKVKDNLYAIFSETLHKYGITKIKEIGLDMWGGCLNVRKMRSGKLWSTHSWGIAIDIDPINNQLLWKKDKAKLAKPIYNDFWDIVYKNGGISLGREKGYDWMHFQFNTG